MDCPWLPYYPGWITPTMVYPRKPAYWLLDQSAARFPDRPAIIHCDGETGRELSRKSYRTLREESDRLAAAFIKLGIRKGDRIAYFLANSPDVVVTFYGILKAGAVVVPCNPMYRGRELCHQLSNSGARAIVCDQEGLPTVEEVRNDTALEHVIVAGEPPMKAAQVSLSNLVQTHAPLSAYPELDCMNDLAMLAYTGGTTGTPKGAALTHYNLLANALQFGPWYQYRPGEEVFISVQPLFHIGGISGAMNVPISVGATLVIFKRFHPAGVLQAIQEHRATRFPGVPTMYLSIMGFQGATSFDLSSLRYSRTSAAALPAKVKQGFDTLVGHEVLMEGYGLSEASPVTHAVPPHRVRAGSIGIPLPDTQARIVDSEKGTEVLPVGAVGELVVRGPQVMKGYWNSPVETADALRDGWLYTGDLARMDEDGYFYIVDRKKDLINAAGFKVWPREVEEVLYRHPLVRQVAVLGVPDAYRGETVKAVIVLASHDGLPLTETLEHNLSAYCRNELAAYKVPRIYEFVDSLPMSAAGKVLRRVLRETHAQRKAN